VLLLSAAVPPASLASPPPLPHYTLDATLRYSEAALDVAEQVRYPNLTGVPLDRLVFQVTPAYYGAFSLQSASANGAPTTWTQDGTVLDVLLPTPLSPGAWATVALGFSLAVPHQPGRFGVGARTIALGNWFPIVVPYRDGWFRHQYVDVGDAFFTEVADFDVTLSADVDISAAHSGTLVSHDGRRWTFHAGSVRDFALVVSPSFQRSQAQAGAAEIDVYALRPELGPRFATVAQRYVDWYSSTFGTYPYPELDVAEVDLPPSYGGMEYPGLVMIGADTVLPDPPDGSYGEYLIAHEIAHQWFYSWVGNDQLHDPWLDEAMATYAPLLYDRLQRPALFPSDWAARVSSGYANRVAAAGNKPVNSSIDDFPSDGPYFTIVYRKGARFLGELDDTMGDEAFVQFLRDYVALFHDKVATPRAYLDLAQQHTAQNLNPLEARFFSYGVATYPAPPAWSITVPPGPLGAQATIAVSADFPVSTLELQLDDWTLYNGPLASPTLDLSSIPPGEYVLLARLTDTQGALLERAQRVTVQH